MGQARSPDSVKAEKMYRKGMKTSEIAKKLGVAANTVSNWKKRWKWDENLSQDSFTNVNKNSSQIVNKKGGQKGNKNAIGNDGGAPLKNLNAVKHGAYRNPYLSVLSDEEKALFESITIDEESLLIEQIQILTIRELNIMKAINKYRSSEVNDALDTVKTIEAPADDGGEMTTVQIVTTKENKDNIIARLERELSTVQNAKTKNIQTLNQIRKDKEQRKREEELHPLKMELLDAQIESIDASTQKLLGENVELEDLSSTDEMLYGGGQSEGETPNTENQET